MKKIIAVLMSMVFMVLTVGCESDYEREQRLQRQHELKMAKVAAGMNPDPVYTNYGYRTAGGLYNDPYYDNIYSHRNSFAENLALAATIGYVSSVYTPVYQPTTRVVVVNGVNKTEYVGKGGKVISKAEYERRQAQSKKDKAAHEAREKEKFNKWKNDPKNASKFKSADKKARDAKAKKVSVNKPKTDNKNQQAKKDQKKQPVKQDVKKDQNKQKTDYAAKKAAQKKAADAKAAKAKALAAKKAKAKKDFMKKKKASKPKKSSYKKRR